MNRIVFGMSMNQRMFGEKISDKYQELLCYLVKIAMCPTHDSVNHWKSEIYNFVPRVRKLTNNNKYPSYKLIMKYAWDRDEDIIVDTMMEEVKDNKYVYTNSDPDSVYNFCKDFTEWWAAELSSNGRVKLDEVSNVVDMLIGKHIDN